MDAVLLSAKQRNAPEQLSGVLLRSDGAARTGLSKCEIKCGIKSVGNVQTPETGETPLLLNRRQVGAAPTFSTTQNSAGLRE